MAACPEMPIWAEVTVDGQPAIALEHVFADAERTTKEDR
jgi:hypothetical protein